MLTSNKVFLFAETEGDKRIINRLAKGCTIANPLYFKLQKMGNARALYGCKKEFKYYEIPKGEVAGSLYHIGLGRGCAGWDGHLDPGEEAQVQREDATVRPRADLESTIKLRDYQEGIPEKVIQYEQGIIRLGTGFGKTIIALRISELLQTKTLIIVPRTNILEQFKKEIRKYFGFEAGSFDRPSDRGIDLSTLQTLQRRIPSERAEAYGCVIVDECHTTVPDKSRAVVQAFAPRFLYGMTATPRRTDGQGEALTFMYGDILVDADLPRATPTVHPVRCYSKIPVWEYSEMIYEQTQNRERNAGIAAIVEKEIGEGRKVLVLTKRIEHFEILHGLLRDSLHGGDGGIIAVRSGGSSVDRADLLDRLRCTPSSFVCLLGTYSLLSTGVDVPSLDTLIIAGDLKSDVLTEQSAGRILRLFDGKQNPKIIDIQDYGNPILKRQSGEREKFYERNNWPIAAGGSIAHGDRHDEYSCDGCENGWNEVF